MTLPMREMTSKSNRLGYTAESAFNYDKKRFLTDSGQLTEALAKSVLAHATKHLATDANILEVGCGTVRFSEFLSKKAFFFLLQHQYDSGSDKKALDFLRNILLPREKFSNWYQN